MKFILALFVVLLVLLQLRLWLGEGGIGEVLHLQQAVEEQKEQNSALSERNQSLDAEVKDLKQGSEAIEERARSELGMIKKDETFFQTVEE
ncbi:MAG: cell division protein FtsB [Gammaproteobacteria bacterium]